MINMPNLDVLHTMKLEAQEDYLKISSRLGVSGEDANVLLQNPAWRKATQKLFRTGTDTGMEKRAIFNEQIQLNLKFAGKLTD